MVFAGNHDATTALMNVLAAQGIIAPHTSKPFNEAMLLGIGGGLGAGYILWEFKAHEFANIVIGFRNRWNYGTQFLVTMAERLGAGAEVRETSGTKAAAQNLQSAKLPVIAWADKASLPYQHMPESLKGYCVHVLSVHQIDDHAVLVGDLAREAYSINPTDFAAARARIGSDKNRIIVIAPPRQIDLNGAITAGINDCIEHLGRDSESFSLPVWKKWAKMLTSSKDKKGWPVVFKERKGLFSTVRSSFEAVTLDDTEGAGLRTMYADFLDEARNVLGNAKLKDAAMSFRHAAELWRTFAASALPDHHTALKTARDMMCERYAAYRNNDLKSLAKVNDELEKQRANYDKAWPLGDAETMALFEDMSAKMSAIYDVEVKALETLKAAMQ